MEKRTRQLIVRWSVVTGGLIALFWGIWYLIAGEAPTITSVKMTEDWTYVLPFGISRWWDILIGPIWSIIIILLLTGKKSKDGDRFLISLGLIGGLIIGLLIGLGLGLVVGMSYGFGAGLIIGLFLWLTHGPRFTLGFGPSLGLSFSLSFGLVFGLVFELVFGSILGLSFLLKLSITSHFWTKTGIKIGKWLLVK